MTLNAVKQTYFWHLKVMQRSCNTYQVTTTCTYKSHEVKINDHGVMIP